MEYSKEEVIEVFLSFLDNRSLFYEFLDFLQTKGIQAEEIGIKE